MSNLNYTSVLNAVHDACKDSQPLLDAYNEMLSNYHVVPLFKDLIELVGHDNDIGIIIELFLRHIKRRAHILKQSGGIIYHWSNVDIKHD